MGSSSGETWWKIRQTQRRNVGQVALIRGGTHRVSSARPASPAGVCQNLPPVPLCCSLFRSL